MPLKAIKFRPGINVQAPLLMNEGGWSSSNLIRFKSGLPQALGGWLKWNTFQFDTPPRSIKSWGDLNGNIWTAVGTDTSVYIIGNGTILNITPLTLTTNPAINFSTTAGSTLVTITDNSVGQLSGSYVNIVAPVSVGEIILQGIYQIVSFVNQNTFTINAASAAVTTVTSAGAVPVFYSTSGSAAVLVRLDFNGLAVGESFGIPISTTVGGVTFLGTYLVQAVSTATVTISIASPGVVTWANHGQTNGCAVVFTTTGALPTGLTAGTTYYVVAAATNTFEVAATPGGTAINTTGTQSGTQTCTSLSTFTIDAATSASSTASTTMNSGNARFIYYGVSQGSGQNYGYGIGGYGEGGYGQGSIYTPAALPTVPLYTFDTWGETLIICVGDGSIFTWTPNTGETQAQLIATAPPVNGGIFVAMPELVLVAWGSSVNGVQQPLLVQWSTAGDYTNWTPTVSDQAGSQTMASGSRVVGAIQSSQQAIIFTDVDAYAMNYLGGTGDAALAWGFIKIGDHAGLIAPRAVCAMDDTVYWLAGPDTQTFTQQSSGGRFMAYNGGTFTAIPCTVWDELFQDLDWANAHKIVAGPNSLFNEVFWFYPSLSGGTGECDSYVKYNTLENLWDYGKLSCTGWQDFAVGGFPLAGHADLYLYMHEVGTSANGAPLNWSLGSSAVMIEDGDQIMFVDWLLPEFQWGMHNNPATDQPVSVTVSGYYFTTDAGPTTQSIMTFSASGPGFGNPRVRGRHLTFGFSGQGFARLGAVRYRGAPDGRYG